MLRFPHIYTLWLLSCPIPTSQCGMATGQELEQLLKDLNSRSTSYTIEYSFQWEGSFLTFFTDQKGRKYVLKQITDPSESEQFLLVLDTVGNRIGEESQIPLNRVRIVPYDMQIPLKRYPTFPATLHTFVEGIRSDEITSPPYKDLDIQQRYRKEGDPMWEEYGPLPPNQKGLTLSVIQNMAKHPDLPKIVALDTFLGNNDRSEPNLFYCISDNRFVGIDMAAILQFNLATEALRHIQLIDNQRIPLSSEEKEALRIYKETLKQLLQNYPAEKIEEYLDTQAKIAGFTKGSPLYTEEVTNRINFHKQSLRENLAEIPKLIEAIERLLGRT